MIQKAGVHEAEDVARLACLLWDSQSAAEFREEIAGVIVRKEAQFFLWYEQETPVAFAQCQLRRDYVEGTHTSPVGYLEGIFVLPEYRHRGIASALTKACETWAKENGCREFASDCEWENLDSLAFHKAIGFSEANRIICFIKTL